MKSFEKEKWLMAPIRPSWLTTTATTTTTANTFANHYLGTTSNNTYSYDLPFHMSYDMRHGDLNQWSEQLDSYVEELRARDRHLSGEIKRLMATVHDYEVAMGPRPRLPEPLAFNRYINASDLVEEFIRFADGAGVHADDMLGLPVELLIKFLVIRAAEEDQEEPGVELTFASRRARCVVCGRFMRVAPVLLDRPACAARLFERQAIAA